METVASAKKSSGEGPTRSKWSNFALLWYLFGAAHVTSPVVEEADDKDESVSSTHSNEVGCPHLSPEEEAFAKVDLPRKLPSIVEIKKALPQHCFEPKTSLSLYYMFKDFAIIGVLYFLSEMSWWYLPLSTQLALTPLYWLVQGTYFTAIFVVGHDAGHGSFSTSELVNTIVGNICHTFLFCPYYMWKISHRHHHKNTGNMDKDEVYYPVRRRDEGEKAYILPGFGLGIGWFAYLVKGYSPRRVNHFDPTFPMFQSHVMNCIVSLVCLAVWTFVLLWFKDMSGWGGLFYHWMVPTGIFGCYIVIITFLHHTEEGIPWYSDQLWDNVRGQLSSVDRNYGWCHGIIHNIGTHQIHHLFSKIPHYHLEEATSAFRKTFPRLVKIRQDSILPSFYYMFAKYLKGYIVDDDALIHIYK